MKNTYSILERNRIVEEHLWCIDSVMRKSRADPRCPSGLRGSVPELALRLIRAVETFDPDKGVLRIHILAQLKYELLSCKTPRRLYGITHAPQTSAGRSSSPLMHRICTARMKHWRPRKEGGAYDTAR